MLTTAMVAGEKVSIHEYKKEAGKDPLCPLGHKLMAKKGKKVVHHFAHFPNQLCSLPSKGMSNWHSQWQKIVLDKKNIEVCIDTDGNITGNSSFRGYGAYLVKPTSELPEVVPNALSLSFGQLLPTNTTMRTDLHIADIIRPSRKTIDVTGNRPLVIEIQHSSIDKTTIESRETYYKDMIWLFNLTPRVVPKGKHNKIVFVDGTISYLKEKVTYVALISSSGTTNNQTSTNNNIINNNNNSIINNNNNMNSPISSDRCFGDEMLNDGPTEVSGIFIIINTRTKYWFDTTKPTYFDCGYGILRLLKKLDKGFALTLYMSYEDFCRDRMPELNIETINSCAWFQTLSPLNLIKLHLMPQIIDVKSIFICKSRVIMKYTGTELSELGMERGYDDWHAGEFYAKNANSMSAVTSTISNVLVSTSNSSYDAGSGNNDVFMRNLMAQAGMISSTPNSMNGAMTIESILILKVRKFLGASNSLDIKIVNMKGTDFLIVYCDKETYNMKDKFQALGMKYKKGTKSISSRQSIKQTQSAVESMFNSATSGSTKKKTEPAKIGDPRTNYSVKVKGLEQTINQLMG